MIYEISSLDKIDFGATGNAAKLQSVRFILATVLESCPMSRGFGWEPPVDAPGPVAKARLSAEIIELIERNITGIRVEEVNFVLNQELGHFHPRVKVVLDNG